jgi:hypothetical protein
MRVYEVRPGDSPAKIAIQHAGCPKCAIDLVRANPHKRMVMHPNGFMTFGSLRPGEQLYLPDKWFNGELDAMPPEYFAALPYADGVTPGRGAVHAPPGLFEPYGALGQTDVSEMSAAAQAAADALAAAAGNYCQLVQQPGTAVNTAVHNFKLAWNVSNPDNPVPINTGNYEAQTAAALQTLIGDQTPPACPPRSSGPPLPVPPMPQPSPRPAPSPTPVTAPSTGLSTGAIVGIGVAAAAAVGGLTYMATRKPKRGRRR